MKPVLFTALLLLIINVSLTYGQAGALDYTFNGTGQVTTRVGTLDGFGEATVVQTDGKILVAGYASNGNYYEFALVRYNTDGSIDNSFGNNGQVITYFPDSISYAFAMALQTDGKIIVAGSAYDGEQLYDDFALARYNTDGSPDNSFGSGGLVTTDFGNSDDYGQSVAIQTDGKIVVGGSSDIYNVADNVSGFALVRYNTNGSIDNSFGVNGLVATNFYNSSNYGHSIAIQPDGKIVVAGSSSGINLDTVITVALMRYTSTGAIDSSFGINGIDTTKIGDTSAANGVALQPDGKIVVTGYAGNNFATLRYTISGVLDSTFGVGGKDTTGFGQAVAVGNALVIQPDTEIVVAGSVGSAFALARYKTNGAIDGSNGHPVKITTTFTGVDDEAYGVALQPDGKIIATGYTEDDTVYYFATARYLPSLLLGIDKVSSSDNSITTYPNPFSDEVFVKINPAINNLSNYSLRVTDVLGREVFHQQALNYLNKVELASFPPAIYFICVTNGDDKTAFNVIKQ